jgi:hypothetical protein
MLCDLKKHLETCKPPPPKKPSVDVDHLKKVLGGGNFLKQLSKPQAEALEKARGGENRSTFQCPYCTRAKYSYIIDSSCFSIIDLALVLLWNIFVNIWKNII